MNAHPDCETRLLEFLQQSYAPEEFPALLEQYIAWGKTRPFEHCRILEATPLFRNTLAKFLPLLAGGATIRVSQGNALPCDQGIADLLPEFGIHQASPDDLRQDFDLVMDCAGLHAQVPSRCGYIELTRSGLNRYQNSHQPVFLADEGQCKIIETSLGTGDGFLRAMRQSGFTGWEEKTIVIFGAGKVGRGIAFYCKRAGAQVFLVDDRSRVRPPQGMVLLDWRDFAAQEHVLKKAWCIVTATGMPGALSGHPVFPELLQTGVLLANMGVEDEFGNAVPDKNRVLNRNRPLNFLLAEPTRLPYIDPTMALCNLAMLELLHRRLPPGLNRPLPEMEKTILDQVARKGCLQNELKWLPGINPATDDGDNR